MGQGEGLPETLCIASIRTDKPVSRHALEVEKYTQNGFTSIEWVSYHMVRYEKASH